MSSKTKGRILMKYLILTEKYLILTEMISFLQLNLYLFMRKILPLSVRRFLRKLLFVVKVNIIALPSLKEGVSIESFIHELNRMDIDYVFLRWFDSKYWNSLSDLDILIFHKPIKEVYKRIGHLADIYSTGPRVELHSNTYLPKKLVEKLSKGRVFVDGVHIPDNYSYSIAFLYHMVFNKNFNLEEIFTLGNTHIKYQSELKKIMNILGINSITNKYVYDLLSQEKCLPSGENFYKYILGSGVYKTHLSNLIPNELVDDRFLFFITRNWAREYSIQSIILETVQLNGYKTIIFDDLDSYQLDYSMSELRGGIWDYVGFDIDGGLPDKVLVCWRATPLQVPSIMRKKYPYTTNFSQVILKKMIRKHVFSKTPRSNKAHFIHGPDSTFENNAYYNLLTSEQKAVINSYIVRD